MVCVNVELGEVLLVLARSQAATHFQRARTDFIDELKTIRDLGMDRTDKVSVSIEVAPRDVLAAGPTAPITLGDRMVGRACRHPSSAVATDSRARCSLPERRRGGDLAPVQVVGWQTGFNGIRDAPSRPAVRNRRPGTRGV
jgi:hypothetical protein